MDIFVKRPVLSLVISLVLVIAGSFAALKLPVLQFPKIEGASIIISTDYFGAEAEVVQGFVTEPIERVAATVPGVDYVDSKTTAGQSTVTIWLNLNEDSADALAELSARLNQIRSELPKDAQDPSIEVRRADRAFAAMYLNAQAEHLSRSALTDLLNRQVLPQLASIEGVQRAGLEGERDPSMRVWIDPLKLAAVNLGASDVYGAIAANNIIAAIGKTENAQQQINLLTNATLRTVEDFEQLIIHEVDNTQIRLGDIARVELGESRGEINARYNNDSAVYISIWPLPGANEIHIADEVYQQLDKLNNSLPHGVKISIAYDGTVYMRNALQEIFITLLETVAIVGMVVLLMMGSFRTALVPLVTIPISILGSVAAMAVLGFSLNLLTILAIVLSVGLVVDDAIVVVENVARHMREGMSRLQAALVSARELLRPIIAMTLTLAAVYAPVGFVSGLTGALFKEFAFTLAIAVGISGIIAITLSPIMSAWINADQGKEGWMTRHVNSVFDRLRILYGRILTHLFNWHWQILFLGLFLALLMVPLYLFSPKELAPTEDQGSITMIIQSPADATLAYTTEHTQDLVSSMAANDWVAGIWQILTPAGGFGGIDLVDYAERDFSVHDKLPEVFGSLSANTGLRVLPILPAALPTAGQFDVELVIKGVDDYATMQGYAYQLIEKAYATGKFMFVDTDLKVDLAVSRLRFDHARLADLGLNIETVTSQIATLSSDQEVNRFDADGKAYLVIPMVEGNARTQPEDLLNLQIRTRSGELIPLSAIARVERETSPRELGKFNQQKSFRIYGGVVPGVTKEQALSSLEAAASELLPISYSLDYAGESRQLRKEGNSMGMVLLLALGVVYLLLTVQFNSFRSSLVVLLGSVPLAIVSALSFSFFNLTTINMYTQIGIITLVGLIAKNGILITEFANELQRQGLVKMQAIIQAAQTRLRPILMTTMATVVGHFPLVLVVGAGAEARNSIGIILVAGMFIGTLFTLFVLPSVYLLFADNYQQNDESETERVVDAQSVGAGHLI